MRPPRQRATAHDGICLAGRCPRDESQSFEDCACGFAICSDAVEAEFGADLEDGLFADDVSCGELAFDAGYVFFADCPSH